MRPSRRRRRRRRRQSSAPPSTEPFETVFFAAPEATAEKVFREKFREIDRKEAPAGGLGEKYRVVEFRARGDRAARLKRARAVLADPRKFPELRLPLGPVGATDLGVRTGPRGSRREWLFFGFCVPVKTRKKADEKLLKLLAEEADEKGNDLDGERERG